MDVELPVSEAELGFNLLRSGVTKAKSRKPGKLLKREKTILTLSVDDIRDSILRENWAFNDPDIIFGLNIDPSLKRQRFVNFMFE